MYKVNKFYYKNAISSLCQYKRLQRVNCVIQKGNLFSFVGFYLQLIEAITFIYIIATSVYYREFIIE